MPQKPESNSERTTRMKYIRDTTGMTMNWPSIPNPLSISKEGTIDWPKVHHIFSIK